MFDLSINNEIFNRARKSIPGGLFSNFKKDKNTKPIYIQSVDGCKLIDFDGNTHYDFSLSAGPAILGHSNEHIKESLIKQIERMYTNEASLIQIEAAEKIVEYIPSAELVRFAISGGEAVYNALRVARGYTGKDMIVKFKGQYHGGMDNVLGGMIKDPKDPIAHDGIDPEDIYTSVCYTDGRAPHALDDVYLIEWNDLNEMESLFIEKGDNIACVIMEPVPLNMHGTSPMKGYLESVRNLCTQHGVVLIFDETLTGFRMGISGAQGYFNVTPDLSIFAKAVGGGFPVSVFCGKKEVMDVITDTKVLSVGTYNGHPLGAAAILATIEELEKNNFEAFERMKQLGSELKLGMENAAKKYNIPMIVQGFAGALYPVFTTKNKIINHEDALKNSDMDRQGEFLKLINERGILHNGRICISAAHTMEDIQYAMEKMDDALRIIAKQ